MVHHPMVLKLHAVFDNTDANQPKRHLVLDLVGGGDLFEAVARSDGFSVRKAQEIFEQMVEGLRCRAVIPSRGVLHAMAFFFLTGGWMGGMQVYPLQRDRAP